MVILIKYRHLPRRGGAWSKSGTAVSIFLTLPGKIV